jgi:hypothetical protein
MTERLNEQLNSGSNTSLAYIDWVTSLWATALAGIMSFFATGLKSTLWPGYPNDRAVKNRFFTTVKEERLYGAPMTIPN